MPQNDSNYTTRTLPRLAICESIPVSRLLSAGGVWEHARYSTVLMHFHELVTLCHLLCFCVSVLPKPALCCLLVQLRTNLTPVFAATAAPVFSCFTWPLGTSHRLVCVWRHRRRLVFADQLMHALPCWAVHLRPLVLRRCQLPVLPVPVCQ